MRHRPRRPGIALAITLIIVAFVSLATISLLSLSSRSAVAESGAERLATLRRLAPMALEHASAQAYAYLNTTAGAGIPAEKLADFQFLPPSSLRAIRDGGAALGKDFFARVYRDKGLATKDFTGSPPLIRDSDPINTADAFAGQTVNRVTTLPIKCHLHASGTDLYAAANLIVKESHMLRYAMFYNGVDFYHSAGSNLFSTVFGVQGLLHCNQALVYNTGNNAANFSDIGKFQFERISAREVYFGTTYDRYRSFKAGLPINAAYVSPVWLGKGDRNGNGYGDYLRVGATPDENTAEYRPAYITNRDRGDLAADAFWKLPSGTSADSLILDSRNPALGAHIGKFNGSYTEINSGFQTILPDGVATAGLGRKLIEAPAPLAAEQAALNDRIRANLVVGKPTDKPASRDSDPDLFDAYTRVDQHESIEKSKLSNQANCYIYVDTDGNTVAFSPSGSGSTAKTAAQNAAEYKSAADKSAWLAAHADATLRLPAGVVDTSRVFFDRTGVGGANPVMHQDRWVRAVDVNFGKLKDAIRTDGAISTGDGSGWNLKNWNGILYVDVASVANPDRPFANGFGLGSSTWESATKARDNTARPKLNADGSQQRDADGNPLYFKQGESIPSGDRYQTAVRIYNAQADQLPHRLDIDPETAPLGFTLATNASVYSVGSVNADGQGFKADRVTPASNPADTTAAGGELNSPDKKFHVPFSLACDSYTCISAGFCGPDYDPANIGYGDQASINKIRGIPQKTGKDGGTYVYGGAAYYHRPEDLEINIALITGNTSPLPGIAGAQARKLYEMDALNNGASQVKVNFSGSNLVLFASKLKGAQALAGQTSCSDRFAYDRNYQKGYIPPGTPTVKRARIVNFRFITAAEYGEDAHTN